MVVSRDESNSQDQHSTHKRSYDRNKLQGPGGRAECKSVGDPQGPNHGSHHHHRQRRHEELRANEVAQHGINFIQSRGQKLTAARVLHRIDNDLAKVLAILEEENGQNRGQEQPPHILQSSGCA